MKKKSLVLVGFAQYWSGCDFNLYIKDEDLKQIGKERTLAIMNHKYDIDWLLGYILCQRISLLAVKNKLFYFIAIIKSIKIK
jgi:hypothetical protein